jgi:hypothetical protein
MLQAPDRDRRRDLCGRGGRLAGHPKPQRDPEESDQAGGNKRPAPFVSKRQPGGQGRRDDRAEAQADLVERRTERPLLREERDPGADAPIQSEPVDQQTRQRRADGVGDRKGGEHLAVLRVAEVKLAFQQRGERGQNLPVEVVEGR